MKRHEYYLKLSELDFTKAGKLTGPLGLHPLKLENKQALAELMLDAFHDTIDSEGESLDDAIFEIHQFLLPFSHEKAPIHCSQLVWEKERPLSACLVSQWEKREYPWISYVFTASKAKNRGLGRLVLLKALTRLRQTGWNEVGAMITEGNRPSEKLFASLGFERIE